MALIPPFFLNCVAAIGLPGGEGELHWNATGFLYGHFHSPEGAQAEPEYRVFLVTNRHVLEGLEQVWIRFNRPIGAPASVYQLDLTGDHGVPGWTAHPDKAVDVAAVPINIQKLKADGIEFSIFQSDQHVLFRDEARDKGVSEGDCVFVLGFPLGEAGEHRNYAIVRQGNIARIRDWLEDIAGVLLIDASIFPGNSGGPVVTKPEMMSIQGTQPFQRAALLGMVSNYVPYRDHAYSGQTGQLRVVFEENSGLALVVPADQIAEVAQLAFEHQLGSPEEATGMEPPVDERGEGHADASLEHSDDAPVP